MTPSRHSDTTRVPHDPTSPVIRDDGSVLLAEVERTLTDDPGKVGLIAARIALTANTDGTRFAVRTAEHLRCQARRSSKTYTRWRRTAWTQVRIMADGRWLMTTSQDRRGYYTMYQYDRNLCTSTTATGPS